MIRFDTKAAVREGLKASAASTTADYDSGHDKRRRERRRPLNEAALDVIREKQSAPLSPIVLVGAVRLADFVIVVITGFAAFIGYFGSFATTDNLPLLYSGIILLGAALTVLALQALRAYSVAAFRLLHRQALKVAAGWVAALLMLLALIFFAKLGIEYSRVYLGLWFLIGFGSLAVFRVGLLAAVRNWTRAGRLQQRAVIVGGGEAAEAVIADLAHSKEHDVRICGFFDDRDDARSPANISGYRKLGTVDDLVEFARHTHIDLLIVTIPITAEARVLQMLQKLWVLPVDIRLAAHTNRLRLHPRAYSYIGNVPFLDVFDKPIADWDVVMKWLFDRIIGTALFVMFLPVMAAVAIAVKLESKGPVFFKQKRHGFNNELIEVYKFRSMYVDQCDAGAAKLVTKDDPRVTRVGRFIRKTSLDEIPQLINVMKGELSLVGPRPHALKAKAEERLYQEVVDGYYARHKVKPGIT
ncbi:MAG: exopolysaccharide biosynthesis polyprenyl glycosylphosphotransferase, partial [Hyphomicrobiales bacterium]|nr:exopolysaccharide biosynthesis polyprenyl glycosylphosphotransferase [Hyphomicrobiales bacterium]